MKTSFNQPIEIGDIVVIFSKHRPTTAVIRGFTPSGMLKIVKPYQHGVAPVTYGEETINYNCETLKPTDDMLHDMYKTNIVPLLKDLQYQVRSGDYEKNKNGKRI